MQRMESVSKGLLLRELRVAYSSMDSNWIRESLTLELRSL
jgi:hypothetical protein